MIAPDDTTYEFLAGRAFAPKGRAWDEALQVLAYAAVRRRKRNSAKRSNWTPRRSARW